MKDKKILITGGAGFIGSALVESLAGENDIIVVDTLLHGNKLKQETLNKIKLFQIDVRDLEAMIELGRGCDCIFHLAAVLGVDGVSKFPVETMDVEVLGMQNIVKSTIINKIDKIVYASTSGVYGHSEINESVKENLQLDPITSYSIAKRYNEIYLKSLFEEKGLKSIALRFFNVYGERQDDRMVIPRFFKQAMSGKPITIFGNGHQTRDFTYIDDVVASTISLAEKFEGFDIFNISKDQEVSILDLANKIVNITGSSSRLELTEYSSNRIDYEVERRVGNSDKLKGIIGYKPNIGIDEGLEKIYSFLQKTPER